MLHQIGVGALGPVFRTYEPTRDRLVAVKVFRLDVIPEQARALADELTRAVDAGLFHPSIVEPVAAGIEGTVAYRAEEYVAAESLDVAMRHYAPASADKVLPFITQLASAVDFARAAGVGHGALHPRDIFVTPDEARATGFGVVDALERLGLRAPVRRPYSPPERIAGRSWGIAADVFSLAAIAFELLTGRRPSGLGDDMGSLSDAKLGEHSEAIRLVLARAMQENPFARPATAKAFSAELAQAAGLTEQTVSLVQKNERFPAPPLPEPEIRITRAGPLDSAELPLTMPVSADQPAHELVIHYDAALDGDALDTEMNDFPPQPEGPSAADSPREVARKVIAAREVRKRQVKKKPEGAIEDQLDAAPPAPAVTPDVAAPAALATTGTLFDAARSETPPLAPGSVPAAPAKDLSGKETPKAEETHKADDVLEAATGDTDVTAPEDDLAQVALFKAVDLVLAAREPTERVVAVDEFKAREAAATRPDRIWPRPNERPESGRIEAETARPDRFMSTKVPPVEALDPDIPPPTFGDTGPERQRLVMLPYAMVLGLGIVIGYTLHYVRVNLEKPAPVATVAPLPAPAEATTGRTAKDTEQVIPPTGAPAAGRDAGTAAVLPAPARATATPPAAKPAAITPPAPREKRPAAASGRIVVTSSPSRAAVVINGKWTGRTPLTLDAQKFGNYVVRVVEPGYQARREQFTLSAGAATRTIDVTLRPAPGAKPAPAAAKPPQTPAPAAPAPKPAAATTGEIHVDSLPHGARVFIDDKEVGVTPLHLVSQPSGSHVIRLELADHQSWSVKTQVSAKKPARVNGSLERIK